MPMLPYRIAGQFYNRPLLLTPHAADTISSFLLSRTSGALVDMRRGGGGGEDDARESRTYFPAQAGGDGSTTVHSPAASRFYGETPLSEDGTRRPLPFRRTAEGVAIVTMVGELVNRGGWVGASSGVISYEGFKYQLESATADTRSKAILLDMECPGGEAVGAFEAAAAVRAAAAVKPVWALVNGLCASAAYAIASGANRIISIPTGISGSIGVVLAHFDFSEYLKNEGIKPTFIHAGANKVDANPYQALPAAVRNRLQAEVDDFYQMFVETVAAGRPELTEKAIRGTEARTFMGSEAKRLGLVDDLGSIETVLAELSAGDPATLQARAASGRGATLSSTKPAATAASSENVDVTEAEASAIRTQERSRLKSILGSPEARGREAQAQELALNTDLSAETCASILKAAPAGDVTGFVAAKEARTPLNLEAEGGTKTDTYLRAAPAASPESTAFWDAIASEQNAKRGLKAPNQ